MKIEVQAHLRLTSSACLLVPFRRANLRLTLAAGPVSPAYRYIAIARRSREAGKETREHPTARPPSH